MAADYVYVVKVENEYACSVSDTLVVFITTGIHEANQNSEVKVYPNPSNGIVNIEWGEELEVEEMKVYDVYGRLVLHRKLGLEEFKTMVDLRKESSGAYFIIFTNGEAEFGVNLLIE